MLRSLPSLRSRPARSRYSNSSRPRNHHPAKEVHDGDAGPVRLDAPLEVANGDAAKQQGHGAEQGGRKMGSRTLPMCERLMSIGGGLLAHPSWSIRPHALAAATLSGPRGCCDQDATVVVVLPVGPDLARIGPSTRVRRSHCSYPRLLVWLFLGRAQAARTSADANSTPAPTSQNRPRSNSSGSPSPWTSASTTRARCSRWSPPS